MSAPVTSPPSLDLVAVHLGHDVLGRLQTILDRGRHVTHQLLDGRILGRGGVQFVTTQSDIAFLMAEASRRTQTLRGAFGK